MRRTFTITALALSGAAALVALPGALRAGDETPRDAVERLLPQLMSDDDALRGDAEKSLFALGEAGRAELERVTRENDPRRAITALRLLQSPKWAKRVAPGEQRAQRDGEEPGPTPPEDASRRLDDLQSRMQREMEEMRRRFESMNREFRLRLPEIDLHGGALRGASSGSIIENDRKTSWTVEEDGRVKVTVQDGKDAPEQTFEAKDFETLKKEQPEIAKRVEPMIGSGSVRRFVWRLDPDQRVQRFDGGRGPADPFRLDLAATPVLGVEWSPVPDVLRDQLELGAGGIVVDGVVAGSLAEKLGLARHDVLLDVNGKSVSGSPDVRAALEDAKAGEKVTATVVRKGQRKVLEAVK